jgi:aryl-alcohol dehydrogenase
MEIKAAVSYGTEQPFVIEKLTIVEPASNEILVKIVSSGICHTDLVAKAGVFPIELPAVFGHEGAGIVEKIGKDVTKVKVGDHVALSFNFCGECSTCKSEAPAYCHSFGVLNFAGFRPVGSSLFNQMNKPVSGNFFGQSSFASYSLAVENNVVKVPENIPFEFISPLGCGIQTGFGAVTRSLNCTENSSIIVIGGGTVGLAAVMAAKIVGCKNIILIEPHLARRTLAMEIGATATIDPINADLTTEISKVAPNGVEFALDTSGVETVIESVFNHLTPKAVYGFVGVPQKLDQKLPGTIMQLVPAGITIKGIIEGDSEPDKSIPELIAHFQNGNLPLEKLVKCYPLENINEAIQAQHQGECVKAVLLINND